LKNSTAILIFTRTPEKEVLHKNFVPDSSRKVNTKIARTLIQQTVCTASKTLLPVFTIDETQQIGSTFGERFANSFEKLFDQGFEKIIAIGNDCPDLTAETLNNTIAELQIKEVVIGPSKDGGMYLVGLSKKTFDKEAFINLPWQKKELLSDFILLTKKLKLKLHLLKALIDLDNFKEVQSYLNGSHFKNALKKLLQRIIDLTYKIEFYFNLVFSGSYQLEIPVLRGPPRLAFS
jgi:glycosyltransferase A (GT-A) superfamily protein (DUF2064 family)